MFEIGRNERHKEITKKNEIRPRTEISMSDCERFWSDILGNETQIKKAEIKNQKIVQKELNKSVENVSEGKIEKTLTLEEKQDMADRVAQEYNESKRPYERAKEKGIEGIKKTENGGVSFAETDKIFEKEDGTKCIVKIEATGKRKTDFDEANKAMGLEETPDGYVWHHIDDYNVKDGTMTMELVEDEVHFACTPHAGGCAQYDAVNGASYNPPRKGV